MKHQISRATRRVSIAALVCLVSFCNPQLAQASDGRIAFVSDRDGNLEVYVMNSDGSAQVNLTVNPAQDADPSWSPDATKLAFTSNRDGAWDIYVMNSDGSGVTRLTINASPQGMSWSPDGSKIAFGSLQTGSKQIFVMNSDGSGQTSLSAPGEFPDWSPDGTKIVWRRAGSFCCNLWTMNANGSSQTQLTSTDDSGPAWSPDGRIVYASDVARSGCSQIFMIEMDGTGLTGPLTTGGCNVNPSVSPDASKIAFVSDRDGTLQIWVMNADGSSPARLTSNAANDNSPAWAPISQRPPVDIVNEQCPCNGPASGGAWRNHGQYVSCVAKAAEALLSSGRITEEEKDAIVEAGAQSSCGKR